MVIPDAGREGLQSLRVFFFIESHLVRGTGLGFVLDCFILFCARVALGWRFLLEFLKWGTYIYYCYWGRE